MFANLLVQWISGRTKYFVKFTFLIGLLDRLPLGPPQLRQSLRRSQHVRLHGDDVDQRRVDVDSQASPVRRFAVNFSRSTFPGHGRFGAHWTGDVLSDWGSMKQSIAGKFYKQTFFFNFWFSLWFSGQRVILLLDCPSLNPAKVTFFSVKYCLKRTFDSHCSLYCEGTYS